MARKKIAPPTRTRYGTSHPERVENELWVEAIRKQWSGWQLSKHLGIGYGPEAFANCGLFSHSSYRDATPGPFWSWERFGRTSTALPDGRIVHVAGEHEDSYDPYFCIYNDVAIEHPDGRWELHLYPKGVFPPTDFHSATLIGHQIVLIGSLGYRDLRREGATQVLKLDTRTLRMETVATGGEAPGWISKRGAERLDATTIRVAGGRVWTGSGLAPNTGAFSLDLASRTWRRLEGPEGADNARRRPAT